MLTNVFYFKADFVDWAVYLLFLKSPALSCHWFIDFASDSFLIRCFAEVFFVLIRKYFFVNFYKDSVLPPEPGGAYQTSDWSFWSKVWSLGNLKPEVWDVWRWKKLQRFFSRGIFFLYRADIKKVFLFFQSSFFVLLFWEECFSYFLLLSTPPPPASQF